MKTPDSSFLIFIPLSSFTSIFFSSGSQKHGIMNSNIHFKHIFIVFINFIFKKMFYKTDFFFLDNYKTDFLILYFQPNSSMKHIF